MRRGLRSAAVLCALTLVGAACSSSKKSTATATTAGGSATTAAARRARTSWSRASPPSPAIPGSDTGFQARITRFNNDGGVDGRKIKFLGVQDDGADSSKDLTEVQSIVLKDHVFAVAPVASTHLPRPLGRFSGAAEGSDPGLRFRAVVLLQ